jgi:anti-sigma regulatory factor (Ser/Thr protein kinase)
MEDLSLHILDIAENSLAAGATHVSIRIHEGCQEDRLTLEIADNGRGMGSGALQEAADPFFTTRTTRRVGLGLPLLEQAARRAGGELRIESRPGAGTKVTAVFQLSHIDRQPLGDVAGTLLSLVIGHPEVDFTYLHQRDGSEVSFSARETAAQLGGIPLSAPAGIAAVRRSLERVREYARG